MALNSNDDIAGIPLMAPVKQIAVDPVVNEVEDVPLGRDASDEPIPLGSPTKAIAVSPQVQSVRDAIRAKNEQERQFKELLRAEGERNQTIAGRFLRAVTITLVMVVAGLGALLFWTQLIQAIAIIGTWSFLPWSFAVSTLAVFAIAIIAAAGRLTWFIAKLRRNRPLTRMLLKERERMREIAQQVDGEAKKQLGKYIAEYPLDDPGHEAFLRRWGVSESDLDSMRRNKIGLLDGGNRQDAVSWQQTFAISYLGPLDKAARQIVREYAILVGVKTAICPYSLLDMSVVIYMGNAMLGSLCRVYQLRAGPFDMVYLFGLILGQAFFAGRIEEHSDEMASWFDGTMGDVLKDVGGAVPDLAANMFGQLAAKGSQGLANGLLLNRIGRQASKMLRPIK